MDVSPFRARKYGSEAEKRRAWSAERRRAAQRVSQPPACARPSQASLHGVAGIAAVGFIDRAFRRSAPSHLVRDDDLQLCAMRAGTITRERNRVV